MCRNVILIECINSLTKKSTKVVRNGNNPNFNKSELGYVAIVQFKVGGRQKCERNSQIDIELILYFSLGAQWWIFPFNLLLLKNSKPSNQRKNPKCEQLSKKRQ